VTNHPNLTTPKKEIQSECRESKLARLYVSGLSQTGQCIFHIMVDSLRLLNAAI